MEANGRTQSNQQAWRRTLRCAHPKFLGLLPLAPVVASLFLISVTLAPPHASETGSRILVADNGIRWSEFHWAGASQGDSSNVNPLTVNWNS